MARAIWKGVIRFGRVAVPVKLFAAVSDRSVHFRLLHASDHTPVEQRMVDPRDGRPVPKEEIRRGYEVEKGEIVMLSDEELDALVPEPSRDIRITRFVDPAAINHQWYDRPYYLGPDGEAGKFAALAAALAQEKREGVARWTMRNKRYAGALQAEDGRLKLITLRHAGEVVAASDLPRPEGRSLDPRELQMAEQLVTVLADDFDPAAFRDEHRERMLALIQAKARGTAYPFRKVRQRRPAAASLTDVLEESIRKARERKIA